MDKRIRFDRWRIPQNKREILEQFVQASQGRSPANEEIDPGAAGWIYSPRQTNRASRVEGGTDTTPPGEREREMKLGWKERPGSSWPSPAGGEVAGAEAQRVAAVGEETGGTLWIRVRRSNLLLSGFHFRMLDNFPPWQPKQFWASHRN